MYIYYPIFAFNSFSTHTFIEKLTSSFLLLSSCFLYSNIKHLTFNPIFTSFFYFIVFILIIFKCKTLKHIDSESNGRPFGSKSIGKC